MAEPNTNRSTRRWLVGVLGVVLLVGVMAYVVREGALESFARLSLWVLVAALGLQLLAQLFFNSSFLIPLKVHLPTLGYWQLFLVRTGGFLAGYVLPVAGGLAVRMAYLRRLGISYQDFASATVLSNVSALVSAALLTTLSVLVLRILHGPVPDAVLWLTAVLIVVAAAAAAAFKLLPGFVQGGPLARFPRLVAVTRYDADMRTVLRVLWYSIARHCANFATFGLLYISLADVPSGFLAGGFVYAVTSPVRMVQVTPGNLGINEWVYAVAGQTVNFDMGVGLVIALVFRAVAAAGQGVGVLIATAMLARRPAK